MQLHQMTQPKSLLLGEKYQTQTQCEQVQSELGSLGGCGNRFPRTEAGPTPWGRCCELHCMCLGFCEKENNFQMLLFSTFLAPWLTAAASAPREAHP